MTRSIIENPNIVVLDSGPAPLDKTIIIEIKNENLFITAYSDPFVNEYLLLSKSFIECYKDNLEIQKYIIEEYKDLKDAYSSVYVENFIYLDILLDKTWLEVKEREIDTKYSGIRVESAIKDANIMVFVEAFNSTQPEYKEYLQIRKINDKYIYSASHNSYCMQYKFGDFYTKYFGSIAKKEEYYICINDLSKLESKYYYFAQGFRKLKRILLKEEEKILGVISTDENCSPVVTTVKGIVRDRCQIIEMTIDFSRTERAYLSIVGTKKKIVYKVANKSALNTVVSEDNLVEIMEDYLSINEVSDKYVDYFVKLKNAYDEMIKTGYDFRWRFGDINKYDF